MRLLHAVQKPAMALAGILLLMAPGLVPGEPGHSFEYPVDCIKIRLNAPIEIVEVEQARPSIAGDRSARVVLAGTGGEPDMAAHWKPVAPPGRGFNNEPRYELAAYVLQRLFLEECEYVVPPVVLRVLPLAQYRLLRGEGQATLRGTDAAFFMLSYWLNDVTNRDPWDPARFEADVRYARHWGNLNILTHIINHKDANIGNLLISRHPEDPRVFAVDNDVAFTSEISDQGDTWSRLQVDRLPAATLARLRGITRSQLEQELGVLADFRMVDGQLVPVQPPGENISPRIGVRTAGERVQFGLTTNEIRMVDRRIRGLLAGTDRGRITAVPDSVESTGLACLQAAAQ